MPRMSNSVPPTSALDRLEAEMQAETEAQTLANTDDEALAELEGEVAADDPFLPASMPAPKGYILDANGFPIPDIPTDVKFVDPVQGYPAQMQPNPPSNIAPPPAPPAPVIIPPPLPSFIPRPENLPPPPVEVKTDGKPDPASEDAPEPQQELKPETDNTQKSDDKDVGMIEAVDDTVVDSEIVSEGDVAMGSMGGVMRDVLTRVEAVAPGIESSQAFREASGELGNSFRDIGDTARSATQSISEALQAQSAGDDIYEAVEADAVYEAETVDSDDGDPSAETED